MLLRSRLRSRTKAVGSVESEAMLTETVAALKTQAVLNKVVATLEAEGTLTENVAVLEHVETLNTMRPDGQLRAEESNDAPTALVSDGADLERLEDKDHVPTIEGGDALEHGGGRDKVANPAQPALPAYRSPPSLPCAPPRLSSPHGHNTTPVLATGSDGRRARVRRVRPGAITQLSPLPRPS